MAQPALPGPEVVPAAVQPAVAPDSSAQRVQEQQQPQPQLQPQLHPAQALPPGPMSPLMPGPAMTAGEAATGQHQQTAHPGSSTHLAAAQTARALLGGQIEAGQSQSGPNAAAMPRTIEPQSAAAAIPPLVRASASSPASTSSLPASRPAATNAASCRPVIAPHRLANQGTLRAHIPQISSQAYIQQASAQLQGFQGGQMYPPFQAHVGPQYSRPTGIMGQMRPPPQQGMRPAGPRPGAMPSGPQMRPNGPPLSGGPGAGQPGRGQPGASGQYTPRPQGRMTPMSGTTAAIPHIKRPGAPKVEWLGPTSTMHIPGTFTVSDRKVRANPGEEETVPMYVLLRLWVQNEPTLTLANGLPRVPSGDNSSKPLPSRPKDPADSDLEPEAPAQPPSDPFRTHFSSQDLLWSHRQHWLKVRRHHTRKRNTRLNHFREHVAALIPDPHLSSSSSPLQQEGSPVQLPEQEAA